MDNSTQTTQNWPDLAIGLYDRLTGRGAEISYDIQNLEVQVPNAVGPDAVHTKWLISGQLSIRTRDHAA